MGIFETISDIFNGTFLSNVFFFLPTPLLLFVTAVIVALIVVAIKRIIF